MTFLKKLQKWGPQLPLDELIVQVNTIYHSFEATTYDQRHPEVHQQLPPIWKDMLTHASKLVESGKLHILDYGCGTGFEAEQLLENIPHNRIGSLVCFDSSPEMLSICQHKIQKLFAPTLFFDNLKEIPDSFKYNVLLTNSLLHHLPNPLESIASIDDFLDEGCVWCAGHEPSKRFYKNNSCIELLAEYNRVRLLRKCFNPLEVFRKISQRILREEGVCEQTAQESFRKNLFAHRPPSQIIGLLVDYHVAHSATEAHEGRGFCAKEMSQKLEGKWRLSWWKTYSFMGPFNEIGLNKKWENKVASIAKEYPYDGANFCGVWKRFNFR